MLHPELLKKNDLHSSKRITASRSIEALLVEK